MLVNLLLLLVSWAHFRGALLSLPFQPVGTAQASQGESASPRAGDRLGSAQSPALGGVSGLAHAAAVSTVGCSKHLNSTARGTSSPCMGPLRGLCFGLQPHCYPIGGLQPTSDSVPSIAGMTDDGVLDIGYLDLLLHWFLPRRAHRNAPSEGGHAVFPNVASL